MFLSAAGRGGSTVAADKSKARAWETFRLRKVVDNTFEIRVNNDQFLSVTDNGDLVAIVTSPDQAATFQITDGHANKIRIKASHGKFLQVQPDGSVKANGEPDGSWSDSDPTVFVKNITEQMDGDAQLCRFYGADQAVKMLKDHWNTFITEDDFNFISSHGLNSVRIPVAWWITKNSALPNCLPANYPGYLDILDRAFDWADKYNLSVIVDLHAAPHSQNGHANSASRDGTVGWGDEYIDKTVQVIEALAARYAPRKSLLAIELLNEPWAPNVSLDTLKRYYTAGYKAVKANVQRSDVYVIMSNRLNTDDPTELVDFASKFDNCVIDVHYYNLYVRNATFSTVEQNINFVKTTRAKQLNSLIRANGAIVFVGEWTTAWGVKGATDDEYKSFADTQMDIYGQASFGWAYWTYKNVQRNWSLKDMIESGIISVPQN